MLTEIPLSIGDASQQLRDGRLTSVALTKAVLKRADELDPLLGAYLARFDDVALKQAAIADEDFARGVDRGALQGIPLAIKDIIAGADGPTTAQSLILDREWARGKDAPVVQRLKKAGAVITGKTNTAEFATAPPDGTKPFPLPKNPWDLSRYTGGSSSGTASGIASGLFLGGLGTDTAGSIRAPSAYCGITGVKPTFGRVPKTGCVPLGFSLDHVGPMARTAFDCSLILRVIAGFHASDPQSARREVTIDIPSDSSSLRGVRIGIDRVHPVGINDGETSQAFAAALGVLEELGATICDVELPLYKEMIGVSDFTRLAESHAYHRVDLKSRWNDYGAQTRLNLARGALVSAPDYVQAQRVRRVCLRRLSELFALVDYMVSPSIGAGAPRYVSFEDEVTVDLAYRRFSNTSYWSPTGHPILIVPMGFTEDKLPVGMQIAAKPFGETGLLQLGHAFQQHTAWHQEVPEIARGFETVL